MRPAFPADPPAPGRQPGSGALNPAGRGFVAVLGKAALRASLGIWLAVLAID